MTKTNATLYRTAILLSIAIHIFFAAVAEAGLILSQKHNAEPIISFMTSVNSLSLRALDTGKAGVKGEAISRSFQKAPASQGVNIHSRLLQRHLERGFAMTQTKFLSRQDRLNQRINAIKNEVIEKQVSMLKSVDLSVYDLEKVPVRLRDSFFSDYLTLMRLKITSEWIPALDQVSCKSCTSIVEYRINAAGQISDLNLLESSGDLDFDRVCLKAVSKSNPLPSLPFQFEKEIKSRYVTVSLTFYFEQRKAPVL